MNGWWSGGAGSRNDFFYKWGDRSRPLRPVNLKAQETSQPISSFKARNSLKYFTGPGDCEGPVHHTLDWSPVSELLMKERDRLDTWGLILKPFIFPVLLMLRLVWCIQFRLLVLLPFICLRTPGTGHRSDINIFFQVSSLWKMFHNMNKNYLSEEFSSCTGQLAVLVVMDHSFTSLE